MIKSLILQLAFISLCFSSILVIILQILTRNSNPISIDQQAEHTSNETTGKLNSFRQQQQKRIAEHGNIYKPEVVFSNAEIDRHAELIGESEHFFHISDLKYLIEPGQQKRNITLASNEIDCKANSPAAGRRRLVIFVNSKWNNFERRRRIRSSWLNRVKLSESLCASENVVDSTSSSAAAY